MAVESYIIVNNCKVPYVVGTGLPHKPQEIRMKQFRKGDIIKGELKHANNQPAFVLVGGALPVPISCVKKVVTKEVVSGADGTKEESKDKKPILAKSTNPKVQYLDAMLIGALLGVGAIYLAEKQGWITAPDKKYKLYGGVAGALLGCYAVFRFKSNKPPVKKSEE